eukprot:TRINITY_DN1819_c0_g1_i1.p1 TRINITY_DN1819_c0_g1~~TRINITY_DN1819_c0_g1_i1.p1  ORF type:complete len:177 (-),score=14.32 TRINITY_DN1819_c0_g1_i1:22-552(-)
MGKSHSKNKSKSTNRIQVDQQIASSTKTEVKEQGAIEQHLRISFLSKLAGLTSYLEPKDLVDRLLRRGCFVVCMPHVHSIDETFRIRCGNISTQKLRDSFQLLPFESVKLQIESVCFGLLTMSKLATLTEENKRIFKKGVKSIDGVFYGFIVHLLVSYCAKDNCLRVKGCWIKIKL